MVNMIQLSYSGWNIPCISLPPSPTPRLDSHRTRRFHPTARACTASQRRMWWRISWISKAGMLTEGYQPPPEVHQRWSMGDPDWKISQIWLWVKNCSVIAPGFLDIPPKLGFGKRYFCWDVHRFLGMCGTPLIVENQLLWVLGSNQCPLWPELSLVATVHHGPMRTIVPCWFLWSLFEIRSGKRSWGDHIVKDFLGFLVEVFFWSPAKYLAVNYHSVWMGLLCFCMFNLKGTCAVPLQFHQKPAKKQHAHLGRWPDVRQDLRPAGCQKRVKWHGNKNNPNKNGRCWLTFFFGLMDVTGYCKYCQRVPQKMETKPPSCNLWIACVYVMLVRSELTEAIGSFFVVSVACPSHPNWLVVAPTKSQQNGSKAWWLKLPWLGMSHKGYELWNVSVPL